MLMHTREGTTIVTQREKINNLFQRLCSVRSFLLSRKHHYLSTGSFHFRTGQAKSEPGPLFLDTFSKSSTLPWKNWQETASWSFFLKLLSRHNILSKQSFVRFLYGAGPLATSSPAWPLRGQKSLPRSLRNSLNSIPRWFQWFFRSFVIF